MKKTPGSVSESLAQANASDARQAFRSLFCEVYRSRFPGRPRGDRCERYLHKLDDEAEPGNPESDLQAIRHPIRLLLIPGMFGECIDDEISLYGNAARTLDRHDRISVELLDTIGGRASCEHNAGIINDYLSRLRLPKNEKLVLIGYSKGTTDFLHFLKEDSRYAGAISRVDAFVALAGIVKGTPLADDASGMIERMVELIPYGDCPTRDDVGIEDISRAEQRKLLASLCLPDSIRFYSLPAFTQISNVSTLLRRAHKRLSSFDSRNDGQVIYSDAILPKSQLLGFANADHWAIALPFLRPHGRLGLIHAAIVALVNRNEYPREVLLESIVRFVDADPGLDSGPARE